MYRINFKKPNIEKQSSNLPPVPPVPKRPKQMSLQIRQQSETSILPKKERKITRQLTNVDKSNFLYFLYTQKSGQKNEKFFAEFLRKTYNFEPPQKNDGPSKKGVTYLSKREENEELIRKLTTSILSPTNATKVNNQEVPLDQVVSQMFEKQLERFPRVRSKIERTQ